MNQLIISTNGIAFVALIVAICIVSVGFLLIIDRKKADRVDIAKTRKTIALMNDAWTKNHKIQLNIKK